MKSVKTILFALLSIAFLSAPMGAEAISHDKVVFKKVDRLKDEQPAAPSVSEKSPFSLSEKMIKSGNLDIKRSTTSFFATTADDANRLYGSLMDIDNVEWGDYYDLGIYSFPADGTTIDQIRREKAIPGLTTYSGVMADGKYYAFTVMLALPVYYLDVYDAYTWEYLYSFYLGGVRYVPNDLAYDPITEKGYGVVYDYDSSGKFSLLYRYDFDKGECEFVGETLEDGILANILLLSSDVKGQLYGISSDGILYKVDKETANLQRVGDTTVGRVSSLQSSTIDNKDNFYWASYDTINNNSALYKVDLKTAKATKLSDFPNNENITGLFSYSPLALDEAPAKVQSLQANIQPGALSGTISFTAPSTSVDGNPISGPLDITIKLVWKDEGDRDVIIDDVYSEKVITATVNAGEAYESENIAFEQASYMVSAVASSDAGKGVKSVIEFWAGQDVPATINDLKIEKTEEGYGRLTWTVPTKGYHGGYLDASSITYTIVRLPDEVTVATNYQTETGEFIDTSIPTVGMYRYRLTPSSAGGAGDSVLSDEISLGNVSQVPYSEDFPNHAAYDLWTVVNVNEATGPMTWGYLDGKACYAYDYVPADDWLISPPIAMKAGIVYQVKFKAWVESSNYPENLKATIGTSTDPATHTIIVKDLPNLSSQTETVYDGTFTVQEDGNYHLGFQCYSDAEMNRIYLTQISIDIISGIATPGAVSDLKAVAGANGEVKATISFKAPEKTGSDGELDEITKIEIFKNGSTVAAETITPVNKGQAYEWTDATPIESAINTYKVVPSNSNGTGYPAEVSVYVGIDIPDVVQNLYLTNVDGNGVLTWEPPTRGANDGYIDYDALIYSVTRSDGEVLNSQVKGLTYTDETISQSKQNFYYYTVRARSDAGSGEGTNSNGIVFGNPYQLPFNESFAGTTTFTSPWTVSGLTSVGFDWRIVAESETPVAISQDGDSGMAQFSSYNIPSGDEAILVSPQINVSTVVSPELSFWFYHYKSDATDTRQDRLQVMVSADDAEFENLGEEIVRSDNNNGWTNYRLSLADYLSASRIRIGFKGIADYGYNLLIDNITIDGSAYPGVTDLQGTVSGNTVTLTWSDPENAGGEALELLGYNIYRNGERINQEPVGDLTYVDENLENGNYIYKVTAIYDKGESGYSNSVTLTVGDGGINGVETGLKIYSVKQSIVIEGAKDKNISIISLDGRIMRQEKITEDKAVIEISTSGIYFVKANEEVEKVIVR